MPRIRLLTSVQGRGAVTGNAGDVLEVDNATARVWADGERAERVIDRQERVDRAVAVRSGRAVDRPG
jgi:hypothetical protein